MRVSGLGMMLILAAGMAQADPISGKAAKAQLFSPKGAEVEMLAQDFLSETDVAALKMVGEGQPYYGAIAVSPDEGLMVEATVAAANYHDTDAASTAALAGCEAKRKGARGCEIVALIRPKGWEPRSFTLSAEATAAFKDGYKKAGTLVLSAPTGKWGLCTEAGKPCEGTAFKHCAEKGGGQACAIAVQD